MVKDLAKGQDHSLTLSKINNISKLEYAVFKSHSCGIFVWNLHGT